MTITTRNGPQEIIDEGSRISYAGICINSEAVMELDGRHVLLKIPKQEVQTATIARGSSAENPKVQIGFGALLALAGVGGTIPLFNGNFGALRYEIGLIFMGAVGAWMLWEAARKRNYLSVVTPSGRRKVRFHGNFEPNKGTLFLQSANKRFGYNFNTTEC